MTSEPSHREQLLESALEEVLGLFDFGNPITIEAYNEEGVLDSFELTEEAQDVVSRAETILDYEWFEEDDDARG